MNEEEYTTLKQELEEMREMLKEEKRKSDEIYRVLMEDDWK